MGGVEYLIQPALLGGTIMKLICQTILVLLASSFCLTIQAQTLPTDDCVGAVSDALDILKFEPLTMTEVICVNDKSGTQMYVYYECRTESTIDQDYYLQAAVGDGKFCRVNYRSGQGDCTSLTGSFEQKLSGKQVSATRRELADFCQNMPTP